MGSGERDGKRTSFKGAGASKSIPAHRRAGCPVADLMSDVSALYLGSLPLRSTAKHSSQVVISTLGHVAHPGRSVEVICRFFVPEGRGSFRSRLRGVSHSEGRVCIRAPEPYSAIPASAYLATASSFSAHRIRPTGGFSSACAQCSRA